MIIYITISYIYHMIQLILVLFYQIIRQPKLQFPLLLYQIIPDRFAQNSIHTNIFYYQKKIPKINYKKKSNNSPPKMIRSQTKYFKNPTPTKPLLKQIYKQQLLSGKQNRNKSPCLSARYHGDLTIYQNQNHIFKQINILEPSNYVAYLQPHFSKQDSHYFKKISNSFDKNLTTYFHRNKTEGCEDDDNSNLSDPKMPKFKKQNRQLSSILNTNNVKQSLCSMVRKQVQSNVQHTVVEQDEQSVVVNNTMNQQEDNRQEQNYEKSQLRARKMKQKKAQLKMQQKNIDSMDKQIHTLLDYLKQGKNNHPSCHLLKKSQNELPSPNTHYHQHQNREIEHQNQSFKYKHKTKKNDTIIEQNQSITKSQQSNPLLYQNNDKQYTEEVFNSPFTNYLNQHQKYLNNTQISIQSTQTQKPTFQNPMHKQLSHTNVIDNKIVKIKQRIQQSQQTTKALGNKYLQGKPQLKNCHNKQPTARLKKFDEFLIIKKIDQIKREIHTRQTLTSRNLNDTFQSLNPEILSNNKLEKQQSFQLVSKNLHKDKEEQSKPRTTNANTIKVDTSNKNNINIDDIIKNKPQNNVDEIIKNTTQKIPKYNKNSWNEVVNNLIQVFDEQIKIDKEFLYYRQMFHNLPTQINLNQTTSNIGNFDDDKWKIMMKKILETPLIKIYQPDHLKSLIYVNAGEGNPFWQPPIQPKPNQQIVINTVVQFLYKSESHWNQKLVNFITKSQMEQSGFSINILDLNKLGHISVQDLVCFINIYTKNLYRNRDLLPIFKRLCLANGLDYQQNKISYQQMENVLVAQNSSSFNH